MKLGDLQVLALACAAISTWLFSIRGKLPSESNWPLFYYLGMVFYQKTGGRFIEANFIYAGVVCAMMIRFEFLSTGFIKVFRFIEAICLVYVVWRCMDYVFFR
ncbi:MAG: hypothetical protein FJW30_22925 [Acidobacteria bacterium]|nr:hypothetical protein [Acidobacteriota bacterium]